MKRSFPLRRAALYRKTKAYKRQNTAARRGGKEAAFTQSVNAVCFFTGMPPRTARRLWRCEPCVRGGFGVGMPRGVRRFWRRCAAQSAAALVLVCRAAWGRAAIRRRCRRRCSGWCSFPSLSNNGSFRSLPTAPWCRGSGSFRGSGNIGRHHTRSFLRSAGW